MTDNYAERGPGTARPSVTDEPKAAAPEHERGCLWYWYESKCDCHVGEYAARIAALEAEVAALRNVVGLCNRMACSSINTRSRDIEDWLGDMASIAEITCVPPEQSHD